MRTLHPQTRENLLRAMRREAGRLRQYLLYATQARKHGRPRWPSCSSRWPRRSTSATSSSRPWRLGQIGMEAENLHLAIEEEAFEAEVMYRDFQAQAEAAGDAAAERFRRLREDERRNRDQFLAVLRHGPGRPGRVGRPA